MEQDNELSRRRLLQGLVVSCGTLGGCSQAIGSSSSPPQLVAVEISNYGQESIQARFRLKKGDAVVLNKEKELAKRDSGAEDSELWVAHPNWGEISEYTASLQINNGEWKKIEPDRDGIDQSSDCVRLDIDIKSDYRSSYYQQWLCPDEWPSTDEEG